MHFFYHNGEKSRYADMITKALAKIVLAQESAAVRSLDGQQRKRRRAQTGSD